MSTPTQTIFVKDLGTKSVTLYPSRARIVRDISDVVLKPGINEVEIYGLSPTIDANSVQVDGKGAATVVDMTVELVPNRDVFEEVYPELDDDNDSLAEEDILDDSDDEIDGLREIAAEVKDLKDESEELSEKLASAQCRLKSIDQYVASLTVAYANPDDIHKILESHEQERAKIFKTSRSLTHQISGVNKKLKRKENEMLRAGKEASKAKAAQKKLREMEKRQKELRRAERIKLVQYEKDERLRYWPKQVYKVVLELETNNVHTPMSSRRGSTGPASFLDSPPDVSATVEDTPEGRSGSEDITISLSLVYVTREAAWTPRYDIDVSSTHRSATIVYRTEFVNYTSETWKDAKILFSTSKTSYQGLNDSIPQMNSWKVRLTKDEALDDGGLLSKQEMPAQRSGNHETTPFNRQMYFDKDLPPAAKTFVFQNPYQQHKQQIQQQAVVTNSSNHALQDYQMQLMILEQQNKARLQMARKEEGKASAPEKAAAPFAGNALQSFDFVSPFAEPLAFSEPAWEDNGLTTTYEIPNTRTLAPGSQTRRHKITSLTAANINLSYIAVPKLKSAAFLLAKLRNPSSNITLLKGSAGVTLDGSYLGNMPLPRVSPNQVFQLSFGVDPDILISYPKPSTKRSTQGLFTKERTQVYTRNIWLTNSKKSTVDLLVLEQIPISEEERLKVEITSPRGLQNEGDVVENVGISAKEAVAGDTANAGSSAESKGKSAKSSQWGSALARLKKNGEVAFTVRLEPKSGGLLKLEYEARMPTTEQITMA